MNWWYTVFVVVATLWVAGVIFGLILPDRISKKVLCWIAEVEHQPYWWAPVGISSLILTVVGIFLAVDINVNWLLLGRASIFLLLTVIWALLFFWIKKRKLASSEDKGE
jgi:uncharacterized membrane protein YfcA